MATTEVQAAARGRRIETFAAEDGIELTASGAMARPELDPEVLSGPGFMSLVQGSAARVLFRENGRADGFSLVQVWFGEDFPLPRHSHSGDCMYYVLRGEIKMGRQTVSTGGGFMLPANTTYTYRAGPGGVEVLEFRTVSSFDMKVRDQEADVWAGFRQLGLEMRETWQRQQPEWAKPLILQYITMLGADPEDK